MKVHAVVALKADYPLGVLLEIAGLARSTFFYHQARQDRPDPHADLKRAIRDTFDQALGRYGHRRIHAKLVATGRRVAKKTVLTLMRQLGLACPVRRRRPSRAFIGEVGTVAPNLLNRNVRATGPNQTWVTDVTEFRVRDHKVYLSPVMDLFDRQIIASTLGASPTLALTNRSLRDALATLSGEEAPLVHSDQGFQSQHASWQAVLADAGATPSMSQTGTCLDNAMMENFFGHLKEECFHHATFADAETLAIALEEDIAWYTSDRISTTLKDMSPVHYRAHALAA
ncbi:MAG: IS3 family transposase [Thermomicrobiales bacterium]